MWATLTLRFEDALQVPFSALARTELHLALATQASFWARWRLHADADRVDFNLTQGDDHASTCELVAVTNNGEAPLAPVGPRSRTDLASC
jgi:hypothetical protein